MDNDGLPETESPITTEIHLAVEKVLYDNPDDGLAQIEAIVVQGP